VSMAMVACRGSSWQWAPRRGCEAIRRTGEWTPCVRVVGEKSEDSNVQGEKEMRWMGHTWPQMWLICCRPVIQLCPTLRSHGRQHTKASLSFTISWSLHKLMFIKLGMLSNHLILCWACSAHEQLLSSGFIQSQPKSLFCKRLFLSLLEVLLYFLSQHPAYMLSSTLSQPVSCFNVFEFHFYYCAA